jgi:hypothetical protein
MRRPSSLLVLIAALGLLLAACASPAGPGASDGGEPSAAAESQAGGDGDGDGDGAVPAPADGTWDSGSADVEVSGEVDASFDGELAAPSGTYAGVTSLVYSSEAGTLTFAITADMPFAVALVTADFLAGSGEEAGSSCNVDYSRSDEDGIEATFRCPNGSAVSTTGIFEGTVTIEGSFSASR